MAWTAIDFGVAGVLMGITSAVFLVTSQKAPNADYRKAVGVMMGAVLLLVWANGAVGIIGAEGNRANLMFYGIPLIGLVGAIIARLRPRGMAVTLMAMTGAQLAVALVALSVNSGQGGPVWPHDLLLATAAFSTLWLLSARYFQRSARQLRAGQG